MDSAVIRAALLDVLTTIQRNSCRALPALTDDTKPLDDLDGFDSKIWPVATTLLALSLGIAIPKTQNIFRAPHTRTALTVAQIVERVRSLSPQPAAVEH